MASPPAPVRRDPFTATALPFWALVAAIVYRDLRAQIADPLPTGQPEIDGVPA